MAHFLYTITDLLEKRRYNVATAFKFLPRMLRGNSKVEFESARTDEHEYFSRLDQAHFRADSIMDDR